MDTASRLREIEEKVAKNQDKEKEEEEQVHYNLCYLVLMHGNRIPHWLLWLPVVARHHAILFHSKLLLLSAHYRQ